MGNRIKASGEWFADESGKPITNFMPQVISHVERINAATLESQPCVKLRLIFKKAKIAKSLQNS